MRRSDRTMTVRMQPPPVDILIITGDQAGGIRLSEILTRAGITNRAVPGLAGIFKAARSCAPGAVVVDLTRTASDMGTDHIVRTLRQAYPSLPMVALCATRDRQIDALAAEFELPLLTQPVVAAELLAALHVQRAKSPALAPRGPLYVGSPWTG